MRTQAKVYITALTKPADGKERRHTKPNTATFKNIKGMFEETFAYSSGEGNVAVAVADREDIEDFPLAEGASEHEGDSEFVFTKMAAAEQQPVAVSDDAEVEDDETSEDDDVEKLSDESSSGEDLLRLYFRDIGKIPLLADKEVVRLAQKIEQAEKKRDKATITKAKKEFVSANLRLVVSIAKRFSSCGMPLLDLIQAGNIGLMKAVDGFEYRMGFKFSTYASKWIQAAITRTISNQVRTVRIPVNVIPALRKVDKASRKLSLDLGRKPTMAEIAKDAGIETEKVRSMAMIPQRAISLDFPVDGDNGDCTLGEILGDTHSPSTSDIVDKHFFREELATVMKETLDDREQKVISLRYGLEDGTEHTQSEIAGYLKLSRQRVSQIESKALMRLRHHGGSKSLRGFLLN